jgi:hypothetical protein
VLADALVVHFTTLLWVSWTRRTRHKRLEVAEGEVWVWSKPSHL